MAANWQRGVLKAMGVKNHTVEVVGVTDLTPWYRRIRLSAPGFLDDLALHPTIWLRLWVPSLTRDKLVQRGYTIIDPDPVAGEFSLDVVLHEPVVPVRRRDPGVPQPVAEVIDRALAEKEGDRFQNAREFRDELKRVLSARP